MADRVDGEGYTSGDRLADALERIASAIETGLLSGSGDEMNVYFSPDQLKYMGFPLYEIAYSIDRFGETIARENAKWREALSNVLDLCDVGDDQYNI
jgi:hypothetical protein